MLTNDLVFKESIQIKEDGVVMSANFHPLSDEY